MNGKIMIVAYAALTKLHKLCLEAARQVMEELEELVSDGDF